MPDSSRAQRALTIEEIAELTRATPRAGVPLDRRISNIAPLDTAGRPTSAFSTSQNFSTPLATTRRRLPDAARFAKAGAAGHVAVLVVREPYRAFVAVARALFPHALRPSSLFGARDAARTRTCIRRRGSKTA